MGIIITGSNGFLGQHLTDFISKTGLSIYALSRGENQNKITNEINYFSIDLTDEEAVKRIVENIKPSVIIHNAAMSKPDVCHANQRECKMQNVDSTYFLLKAAAPYKPYFLYVSTDFVFGENGPHDENEKPAPLNYYGETKLMAEQLVRASGLDYGIMRPVFIYGQSYENMKPTFLHWVQNSLLQNKPIKVVNDQKRTPTYVYDICKGILSMIEKRAIGDFHLAGKELLSPYQMAVSVAEILKLDANLITPVTSETFPEPVIRAKKSGLKIEKARTQLDYNPISFQEGIRLTFNL